MYDTLDAAARRTTEAGPSTAGQRHRSERGPRQPASASTCWTTSRRPARSPSSATARVALAGAGRRHRSTSRSKTCSSGSASEEVQTLNIILRADVRGSIEAIQKELAKLAAPRSADQDPAGDGRRHHRGRRPPGRRLGRDHHRLQRRARRKRPHAGRRARRADSPLRHHLQGDRRPAKRRWKECSSPRSARSTWAGRWCSGRSRSAAWARSPAAACWPASSQRNAACG